MTTDYKKVAETLGDIRGPYDQETNQALRAAAELCEAAACPEDEREHCFLRARDMSNYDAGSRTITLVAKYDALVSAAQNVSNKPDSDLALRLLRKLLP